jgi:predicted nucleotidyltransferase
MPESACLHLPDAYRQMVQTVLHRHLPQAEVWAYGSRVNGDHHEASDLDLVVRQEGDALTRIRLMDTLREAFSDSDLPLLVQVVDWAAIPESFRAEISHNYVVLQRAGAATS